MEAKMLNLFHKKERKEQWCSSEVELAPEILNSRSKVPFNFATIPFELIDDGILRELDGNACKVLQVICRYNDMRNQVKVDDDDHFVMTGWTVPVSEAHIAERSGLSRRTVIRKIQELVDAGIIEVDSSGKCNRYRILAYRDGIEQLKAEYKRKQAEEAKRDSFDDDGDTGVAVPEPADNEGPEAHVTNVTQNVENGEKCVSDVSHIKEHLNIFKEILSLIERNPEIAKLLEATELDENERESNFNLNEKQEPESPNESEISKQIDTNSQTNAGQAVDSMSRLEDKTNNSDENTTREQTEVSEEQKLVEQTNINSQTDTKTVSKSEDEVDSSEYNSVVKQAESSDKPKSVDTNSQTNARRVVGMATKLEEEHPDWEEYRKYAETFYDNIFSHKMLVEVSVYFKEKVAEIGFAEDGADRVMEMIKIVKENGAYHHTSFDQQFGVEAYNKVIRNEELRKKAAEKGVNCVDIAPTQEKIKRSKGTRLTSQHEVEMRSIEVRAEINNDPMTSAKEMVERLLRYRWRMVQSFAGSQSFYSEQQIEEVWKNAYLKFGFPESAEEWVNDRLYVRTQLAELGVCDEYTENEVLELIEEAESKF